MEVGPFGDDLGDQFLGLPAGRAVADRDDADLVLADEILEEDLRLVAAILGRVRVDHAVVEQLAVGAEDRHLAAVPESGVDGHHDLLGDRRLEQEAPEIAGEDVHGVPLGHLGQVAADLTLHAGQEQAVEGVEGRLAEEIGLRVAFERELGEGRGLDLRAGRPRA